MANDFDNNKSNRMDEIRGGSEQAFEQLFKEYYLPLSRFAWRYVHSKAVAEELAQEVFADIWADRATWEPGGSVRAYLYKAVKHKAIDHIRHKKVQQKYNPEWMEKREENTSFNFEDRDREEQIREAIKKEIEALPTRSKMTFKLHRFDGLTYPEIAEVMDVSVKTVESQMSRTLKKLRERLSHLLPILILAMACS